ncbi:MAG: recombination regulator RecX [Clostridia bacterium]|nr:recombination regulator RecX [Clostridia bacterium]
MENTFTVETIAVRRGQLYLVTLSDGREVEVDRRTWDESPYRANSALTEESLSALLSLSEENRARDRALYLLSRRDYTKKELSEKLRKAAGREVCAATAERMEELGLVDDESLAVRYAREYCLVRHYPKRRAVQKLREKGIDRDVAAEAVEKIGADDLQAALAFLDKKCYTQKDEQNRRKIADALARYGFDYDTVRTALRQTEQEEESC